MGQNQMKILIQGYVLGVDVGVGGPTMSSRVIILGLSSRRRKSMPRLFNNRLVKTSTDRLLTSSQTSGNSHEYKMSGALPVGTKPRFDIEDGPLSASSGASGKQGDTTGSASGVTGSTTGSKISAVMTEKLQDMVDKFRQRKNIKQGRGKADSK
jgi:hypothetical protein